MQSQNIKYIPRLDHIRAYASILIVLYHSVQLVWHHWAYSKPFLPEFWVSHRLIANTPLLSIILEGHTAVALFMVLSGFVFTVGAYKKEISYPKFLLNRFLRTYPLFLLLLFTGIASFPKHFNLLSFLQTVLALANANSAISLNSFSAMFWTIAIEWQFYLIFPFLLIILNKKGTNSIFGIIAVFILMRILSFLFDSNIRDVSYWTIIGRSDQFLAGMLIAVIYKNDFSQKFRKILPFCFIVALTMVFYSSYWFNQNGGWPVVAWWRIFWPTLEGFLWAFFIICYLTLAVSKHIPEFISTALAGIGKISYSIYLIHFIVIQLAIKHNFLYQYSSTHLVFSAFINAVLIIIPITIIISIITFVYIEKPFLDMRIKYKKNN